MRKLKIPIRYLPQTLSQTDKKKQINMLLKSKKMYKKQKYYTRKPLSSYKNKTSKHILTARKIYGLDKIVPNKKLSTATGCSVSALKKIVEKRRRSVLFIWFKTKPNTTILGFSTFS